MKNLITTNLYALMLYSLSVNAAIDSKAVFSDAFEFGVIKLVIAAVIFYILSFGLINKPKDTAIKNGRWFASIFVAFSIIGSSNIYKNLAEYIYALALVGFGLYVIGFALGYLWKSFNKQKVSEQSLVIERNYISVFFIVAVICFAGLFLYFTNVPQKKSLINQTITTPSTHAVKLGDKWNWKQISKLWWVAEGDYNKNNYGLVEVWLKIEIMQKAKDLGVDYSHTVVNAVFSCTDKTFKFNSITDVFKSDYINDKPDLTNINSYKDFSKIEENDSGLTNAYHFVCDR